MNLEQYELKIKLIKLVKNGRLVILMKHHHLHHPLRLLHLPILVEGNKLAHLVGGSLVPQ